MFLSSEARLPRVLFLISSLLGSETFSQMSTRKSSLFKFSKVFFSRIPASCRAGAGMLLKASVLESSSK